MALTTLPDGNYALSSSQVYYIPFQYENASGTVEPAPSGDTFAVAANGSFAASLNASMGVMPGTSDVALILAATVLQSNASNGGGGIGLTITDSAGLMADSTVGAKFDIVDPTATATQFGLNLPGVVTIDQSPPTAPGP